MGYKYQKGSTPDHVNSEDSVDDPTKHIVPIGSDSTKKIAPVDTVALKKNITSDNKKADYYTTLEVTTPRSDSRHDVYDSKVNAAEQSSKARSDTLSQARKGKIPAKP